MFLVSGGYSYNSGKISTTEIYDPELGKWRYGANLPSHIPALRAANIDGRVLIFGINILGLTIKIHTGSSIMIVRKFLLNALKIWLQMAS